MFVTHGPIRQKKKWKTVTSVFISLDLYVLVFNK